MALHGLRKRARVCFDICVGLSGGYEIRNQPFSGAGFVFMKILFDYNRTLFDPDAGRLYDGVSEMLEALSVRHDLYLVSRNEPARERVFLSSSIRKFFVDFAFVGEKSEEILDSFIRGEEAIVIGDSIRDEIRIGNRLGCTTIRLLRGKFKDEKPSSPEEQPDYEAKDMSELVAIIRRYEK
jgi:FMN phosphatase YigB (HAD superfamily)